MPRQQQGAVLRQKEIEDLAIICFIVHTKGVARARLVHQSTEFTDVLARSFIVFNAGFEALADFAPRSLVHAPQYSCVLASDVDDDGARRLNRLRALLETHFSELWYMTRPEMSRLKLDESGARLRLNGAYKLSKL